MAEDSRARSAPPRRGMPVVGGLGVGAVLLELTMNDRNIDATWDDEDPTSGDVADGTVDSREHSA